MMMEGGGGGDRAAGCFCILPPPPLLLPASVAPSTQYIMQCIFFILTFCSAAAVQMLSSELGIFPFPFNLHFFPSSGYPIRQINF
jgi:hypothetical protein